MPRAKSDYVELKLRMKEPLRAAIEDSAKSAGVSMNAEAIRRLDASFDRSNLLREVFTHAYGPELGGLLMMIGSALRRLGPWAAFSSAGTYEASKRWLDNPYAFDQAVVAANVVLEALRPEGAVEVPRNLSSLGQISDQLSDLGKDLGKLHGSAVVAAVAGEKDPDAQRLEEGRDIAEMLGPAADRLKGRRSDAR